MTENNLVMEDRQNPSLERKPKPPRKSPSDFNALNAKKEELSSLAVLKLSFF